MAVGEALTNLVWARIDTLEGVKCSANWMWAPKLPGEGAALYDAACAMRDAMIPLGIAVDGGKDSLSMATMIGDETVKSPRELVISAYAAMSDIRKVVTPDLKRAGASSLLLLDLGSGKNRLGGSALAQTRGRLGIAIVTKVLVNQIRLDHDRHLIRIAHVFHDVRGRSASAWVAGIPLQLGVVLQE